MSKNTIPDLPQHLIVLSNATNILPNMLHAHQRLKCRAIYHAAFRTGLSAAADTKRVLIHKAQGMRSLSAFPFARSSVR